MYCTKCGAKLFDESGICQECGAKQETTVQAISSNVSVFPKSKVPPIGKWIIRVIGVLFIVGIIGMLINMFFIEKSAKLPIQYISTVKEATIADTEITYGEAFDEFFTNPKWEHFISDQDEHVVEFTGGCIYLEEEAETTLQFVFPDVNTFELYYLDFNGELQPDLMKAALLSVILDTYE